MNFIKKIFGYKEDPKPSQGYLHEQRDVDDYQRFSDFNDQNRNDFGFRVFSEPIEMHRYFERQMNEMFKNFGVADGGGGGPFFGGTNDPFFGPAPPQIPAIDQGPRAGETLRDQYLKPGFEKSREMYRGDRIIDGHVDISELDPVIKPEQEYQQKNMVPQFKSRFFGQSMRSKTIVGADGTTEIHQTVRDSRGNEETTVTKKCGDKEYTVTTKMDSTGKKEINENIVNMDETELEAFKNQRPDNRNLPPIAGNSNQDIFDKYFGAKM